ncbi:tRNA (adenosine(37)-N6)-dimethylallyltransferase MiaA [Amphiplicatus metriothermophilus]|uniref:tRNA (adenosine(37)-N6)-dimethylallyltransferase MiaA n=1 Tax=Amphiplicatus metriothermophilus TaxID=1519374 RepID=UPI0017B4ECED|nr:tRNA (adenosine(37)-N6)-dimethylallyltransferase MiaA [Amphiplicatus metriothermophilus]MBB5518369.1 tRNA dimethylallyltransferase [Amphiplicatus metriothermophilus]
MRTVFIAGPTASGKSAAALALAEALGGEIVNADALQVYADLDILSARPGPAERARAPHHLYGFIDGAERCSAGRWARQAARVIAQIAARGRFAVVVGGTGLYFRALEEGLSPIPEVPGDIRRKARARLEALGSAAFREEVVGRDPDAARIAPGDRQRLLRAWEVVEATGRPLTAFQAAPRAPLIPPPAARVVIEQEREALYAACEKRFDEMVRRGAIEEARRLLARGLDPELPVMKALGAAELMAHCAGRLSLDEAVVLAKRNTRRFAKRQLTWFRHQAAEWPRARDWREAIDHVRQTLGR